jgi:hypothetical protein
MPILRLANRLVLFIHVPRTGGTTIESHLGNAGTLFLKNTGSTPLLRVTAQHLHGRELVALFPAGLFDYAFMVVRHPVQKMLSEYGYARLVHPERPQLPFRLWLRMAMFRRRLKPHRGDNHFRAQTEFECFDAEVFKFEDGFDPIFRRLEEVLGIPAPGDIVKLKASPREIAGPVKLSRRDVDLIYRHYRGDFDRYGYDPEKY